MSITHGNDGKVFIGANQIAEVNDFTLNESIDTVEGSSMGDSNKKYVTGLKDWDVAMTCWWDVTDTNGQEAMLVGTSISLILYPQGNASGDATRTCAGTVETASEASSKDGIVTRSFTVKPDSTGTAVARGTVA